MNILLQLRRTINCFPDSPAVIDGEVRMNWREVEQRIRKLAIGLQQLGIQKGERVAILALNGFRYLEYEFAVPRMGGLIVPLNTRFSPAENVYTLNDSGSVALMVDDAFVPMVEKIKADLKTVRHFIYAGKGSTPEGFIGYEALLENADDVNFADYEPDGDDVVGIFYTGGTTGHPKGVMLTHKNLSTNALHFVAHLPIASRSNYLHSAPMFHLADGSATFFMTMMGGCHTFMAAFDPAKVLETVQREKITHAILVPTMINAVLQVPNIQNYDLSSWQYIIYGASPIPLEVLKKAMQSLPCSFLQAYGMTEAAPLLTVLPWNTHQEAMQAEQGSSVARRLLSCGQPAVGVDVRIFNEQGGEVKPGEIGEIVARGPNIMKGYWNLAEETSYGLRDGWLHTGDLATCDDHNFYYIVDRKKDMIISGAENVYSNEVENAIYAHPAVLEAAVIGVPDPKWGERVHAVVVLKPGQPATEQEIIEKCRELIAGYKVPRSLEFIDALPKSGAGKILKRNLRDKYWQGQNRQVH